MESQISDAVVGLMMGLFALLGLVMAAYAHDTEIYVFGLGLAAFGTLFIFGQIRRRFDEAEARAAVDVVVERRK